MLATLLGHRTLGLARPGSRGPVPEHHCWFSGKRLAVLLWMRCSSAESLATTSGFLLIKIVELSDIFIKIVQLPLRGRLLPL